MAVLVRARRTATGQSDDEGRALPNDPDPVEVQARVAVVSSREKEAAAQRGEEVEAALHLPWEALEREDLDLDESATIEVPAQEGHVPSARLLLGTWAVTTIRPTRTYARVLLRRTKR